MNKKFQTLNLSSNGLGHWNCKTLRGLKQFGRKAIIIRDFSFEPIRSFAGNFTVKLPFLMFWLAEWGIWRRSFHTWNTCTGFCKDWKIQKTSLTSKRWRDDMKVEKWHDSNCINFNVSFAFELRFLYHSFFV